MRGFCAERLGALLCALFFAHGVASSPGLRNHDQLLITPPPAQPTRCPNANLLARQASCQFGQCGNECLSQGAFCCGPAGSRAVAPLWICDNGACITSVRGTTGIVDCYDPDNPSGTTQSCLDLRATTSCNPTDRCFTCDSEAPFCQWQTYIESNSPTLRWFSCVTSKVADLTFLATIITAKSSTPTHSSSSIISTSITPTPTLPPPPPENKPPLSTGGIIGLAVAIGLFLVTLVAGIIYFCLKRREKDEQLPQELETESTNPYILARQRPVELESRSPGSGTVGPDWTYARGVENAVASAEMDGKREYRAQPVIGELDGRSAEGRGTHRRG